MWIAYMATSVLGFFHLAQNWPFRKTEGTLVPSNCSNIVLFSLSPSPSKAFAFFHFQCLPFLLHAPPSTSLPSGSFPVPSFLPSHTPLPLQLTDRRVPLSSALRPLSWSPRIAGIFLFYSLLAAHPPLLRLSYFYLPIPFRPPPTASLLALFFPRPLFP